MQQEKNLPRDDVWEIRALEWRVGRWVAAGLSRFSSIFKTECGGIRVQRLIF
jgi:hypothetical protein